MSSRRVVMLVAMVGVGAPQVPAVGAASSASEPAFAAPRSLVRLRPATVEPGGVVAVVIDAPGVADPDVRVRFRDRDLGVFQGTDGLPRALAGVDLATAPGTYAVEVVLSAPDERDATRKVQRVSADVEVRPRTFPREDLTVAPRYVEPDAATQARIRREEKRLEAVLGRSAPRRSWHGEFLLPADGPLGSPFGLRRFFNGQERRPHSGQDVRVPEGTPVVAAQTGTVVLARSHFFSGNTVVLDHGLGLFTLYFHLVSIPVKEGSAVERGALIGYSGKTGRVTGAHLHWAARLDGARIDPLLLLRDPAAELNDGKDLRS